MRHPQLALADTGASQSKAGEEASALVMSHPAWAHTRGKQPIPNLSPTEYSSTPEEEATVTRLFVGHDALCQLTTLAQTLELV